MRHGEGLKQFPVTGGVRWLRSLTLARNDVFRGWCRPTASVNG